MSQKLYVGNLSFDTTEETLRTLFAEFGQLDSVSLVTDRYTGRSRGFAFVEMSNDEEAQEAIKSLNGKQVDNREIKVDKAKPQASRDRQRGGGGRPRW